MAMLQTKSAPGRKAASLVSLGFLLAASSTGGLGIAHAAGTPDPVAQWNRVCGTDPVDKKETCQIRRMIATSSGTLLGEVAVQEKKGDALKSLAVSLPPGMLIQPGVKVMLDDKRTDLAKYTLCAGNCFAELPIKEDYIAGMKKATLLKFTTLRPDGKSVEFDVTLDSFAAAYDGPPLDQAAQQKKQQELQSDLENKARAAQQKLIDAQKAAQQPQQ